MHRRNRGTSTLTVGVLGYAGLTVGACAGVLMGIVASGSQLEIASVLRPLPILFGILAGAVGAGIGVAIGFAAHGRWWTETGPWQLGRWFRPLALVSVGGCVGLIVIGMQPPNDQAAVVVGGFTLVLATGWFSFARRTFPGPPQGVLSAQRTNAA